MNQNILTLGQINEALHYASVSAAQLAKLGFASLDNKAICEGLPPEQSRQLRVAKIYRASDLPLIRVALSECVAQHAAPALPCTPGLQFERNCPDDTEGGALD